MKLLIAVDSTTSAEVLVDAIGIRPWPEGTTAHMLSVIADMDVPEEVWREALQTRMVRLISQARKQPCACGRYLSTEEWPVQGITSLV